MQRVKLNRKKFIKTLNEVIYFENSGRNTAELFHSLNSSVKFYIFRIFNILVRSFVKHQLTSYIELKFIFGFPYLIEVFNFSPKIYAISDIDLIIYYV